MGNSFEKVCNSGTARGQSDDWTHCDAFPPIDPRLSDDPYAGRGAAHGHSRITHRNRSLQFLQMVGDDLSMVSMIASSWRTNVDLSRP
jgi:hypothetical protein